MSAPEVMMSLVEQVWVKQMHFLNAGDANEGHSHIHDHITLLAKGSVEVEVEGVTTVFTAPHIIVTRKDKKHSIKALEPGTIAYCIHASREFDTGEIVDPSMLPKRYEPLAQR